MAEKRNTHTYKCTDKEYSKAMKRAQKLQFPLTKLIEMVISGFSEGLDVTFMGDKEPSVTVTLQPTSIKPPNKNKNK